MGGKCPHRSVKKRRYSHKTHRRAKFLVKDILFHFSLCESFLGFFYLISFSFLFLFFFLFFLIIILKNHQFVEFSLTLNRSRDDMVYDELKKPEESKSSLPVDEDLPGMGQYYCLHCEYVFLFD